MLDETGSVESANFHLMKWFVWELVGTLDIDSGNTRVGLLKSSTYVKTAINLKDHSSITGLQSAISSLSYPGPSTSTAVALAYVRNTMLTSAAGDRSDVPNVVVILTDGLSMDLTATQVSVKFSERYLSGVEI